jgi:hypothetical protein
VGCPDGDLPPGLFTRIENPGRSFWDIVIPGKQRRAWGAFSMYQITGFFFGFSTDFWGRKMKTKNS